MTNPADICLDVRGKLTIIDPDNPSLNKTIVYQKTSPQFANYYTKKGEPRQIRNYIQVVNPKTTNQLKQQALLRLAVEAWQTSTEELRQLAEPLAKSRSITLYMAFISIFIKAQSPIDALIWDKDSARWDGLAFGAWDNNTATWENGAEPWDYSSAKWDYDTTTWDALKANAWDNFTTIWAQ